MAGGESQDNKTPKTLVKATELPLHGNPFPPKEPIEEQPSQSELKVRSWRLAAQPYLSPVCAVYDRTKQFMSTGKSHTQEAIQMIRENPNNTVGKVILASTCIFGAFGIYRPGIFRKIMAASVVITGSVVAFNPEYANQKAQLALYIAKNKLPELAKEQFSKFKDN